MKKQSLIISAVILLALVVGIYFIATAEEKPGANDQLAQCLTDNGVKFFGAFWCPHCQDQKTLFGKKSTAKLDYIECSTPDGGAQTQACIDSKIEGYPTWELPSPIVISSEEDPIVCSPRPGKEGDPQICQQKASHYVPVWIFPDTPDILSGENPVINNNTWTFSPGSRFSGVVSLEMLAEQTSCPLSNNLGVAGEDIVE